MCGCPAHRIGPGPVVLNRHYYHTKPFPAPWTYIGRGTPLGNPYTVVEHGIEAALQLYRKHLWRKIQARDVAVMAALGAITDAHHLMCSCAPRPCHGDVVVAAVKWLREQKIVTPSP